MSTYLALYMNTAMEAIMCKATVRLLGASLSAVGVLSAPATAQEVDSKLWIPNGPVYSIARGANTIYIGGAFTSVGPPTGGGVPVSVDTGERVQSFPRVDGVVNAVAPDATGGWYIGGNFRSVGGVNRSNLAHVLADGSVADWDPGVAPLHNEIYSLVVSEGTVYVGGFPCVAALDAESGAVIFWHRDPSCTVSALAVSGESVYVGGDFTTIGGQPRSNVAAVDAATGVPTPWNPGVSRSSSFAVLALAASGSTVYVGGAFSGVGGQPRNGLAAVDADTGVVGAWNPAVSYPTLSVIRSFVVSGGTIYVGGTFTLDGQERGNVAAFDAATGAITAWSPNANDGVHALAVSGSRVYAGGRFTSINGLARRGIAALDLKSGALTDWNPAGNGFVYALVVRGDTVFAGGEFTHIGGLPRSRLAELDAVTGAATAWNPAVDGWVQTLATHGNTVYVGGGFRSIGGQPRNGVAALDGKTGAATAWNPAIGGSVYTLATHGNTVYAGGGFGSIGGQPRNGVAALDGRTGAATAWDAHLPVGSEIYALAVVGSEVYVGGYFNWIVDERPRRHLASFDASTGTATAWNPDPDGGVFSLAVSEQRVYAGGYFQNVGGKPRGGLAELDAESGAATDWRADTTFATYALAADHDAIYAGGDFNSVQGKLHPWLVGVTRSNGH